MTNPTSHPARSHLTLVDDRRMSASAGATVGAHPALARSGGAPVTDSSGSPAPGGAQPRPASRRRAGWFEANPGCFGRAALAAFGVGTVAGGAAAWGALRAWRSTPVRRTLAVTRFGRRAWRRYRRVRNVLVR